nr:probable glutamate receptor [Rhipicephalus microplus]
MKKKLLRFPPYLNAIEHGGHTELTGVAGNLAMLLIEALQFQVTFMTPSDGNFGVHLPSGDWTGLFGMVAKNEADISPGPFLISNPRIQVANPSFPWAYENMIIFAAKPLRFTTNVFGFANAFSGTVWAASIATLLLLWIVLAAVLSKTFPPKAATRTTGRRAVGRFESFPGSTLPRCLIAIWLLALIVLRTSFLGEMKASLVVRTEVPGIRSVEDLAKMESVTPIVLKESAFYTYIKEMPTDVFKKVMKRIKSKKGEMEKDLMFGLPVLRRILKGEAALFMSESGVAAQMRGRCEKLVPLDAEFYYAPRPVTQMPLSMFTSKRLHPPLRWAIEKMIKIFVERGFVDKFYRDSRLEMPPCRRLTAQSHSGDSPQLDSLQGVFFTLLAGLSMACAVLLAEILRNRAGRHALTERARFH